jgi:hypothetical protein
MHGFGKIYKSIFRGTLAEKLTPFEGTLPVGLIVFILLITNCDSNGIVDMTTEALARETNFPIDFIKIGLAELQEPDEKSRSPLLGGRRIVLLEPESRDWGWLIVNHAHYKNLQSKEDRQEYMRGYMKDYMEKKRNGGVKKALKRIEYSPEFEQWWTLYPSRKGVKAGKEAALDEFKKAIQSEEDFQQLLKATERYKSVELPKDGERFLKKNYFRDWIGPDVKEIKPGQPAQVKDGEGNIFQIGQGGEWKKIN